MNSTRRILLWGSSLLALAAAVALWRAQQRLVRLASASTELIARTELRRTSLEETGTAAATLKSYLQDVQRHVPPPDNYDDWSRQQHQNRTALHTLRQRAVDLQAASPFAVASLPELTSALMRLDSVTANLVTRWTEYDRLGTGLTRKSELYATETLLPLVTDELEPALADLRPALQADTKHLSATIPIELASARRLRLIGVFGLFAGLAGAVAAVVLSRLAPTASLVREARPRLTASDQKATETPPPPRRSFREQEAAMPPGAPRLLIVEPNAADGEILSLLLSGAGYGILHCDSSADALDALRALRFHLVLLDRQLPGTADVLHETSRDAVTTPVVLLTDSDTPVTHTPFASQVIAGFVRKPVDPKALMDKVTSIIPIERVRPVIKSAPEPEPDSVTSSLAEPFAAPVAAFAPEPPAPVVPESLREPAPPEAAPPPATPPAVRAPEPPALVPEPEIIAPTATFDSPEPTSSSANPPLRKRLVRKRLSASDEPPAPSSPTAP